jgi:Ras-related protein Rab-8A
MEEHRLVKLLILGESGVGKSCLVLRFAENQFSEAFLSTIGIDFKLRVLDICGQTVTLQIWDIAGQEQSPPITKPYYHGAHGIMLVFDVTDVRSFNQTKQWFQSIHDNVSGDVVIVLMGNKSDKPGRTVTFEQGQAMAKEFGVEYFETSAKSGQNVESTFLHLAKAIVNDSDRILGKPGTTQPQAAKPEKRTGICS